MDTPLTEGRPGGDGLPGNVRKHTISDGANLGGDGLSGDVGLVLKLTAVDGSPLKPRSSNKARKRTKYSVDGFKSVNHCCDVSAVQR
uniref:Uncharacterized protein n=1 Tax=Romanomermis culicivorax TaxID=13658 RepID=A0A915JXB0_ROMCU